MSQADPDKALGAATARRVRAVLAVLLMIAVSFAVARVITDWPHILNGTVPDNEFATRYVAHPQLAYLHIGLGVVYLLGAPLQLSRRYRTRHYTVHRRLGRLLLSCALLSGLMALAFGVAHAWGGTPETVATVVFGIWFLTCLVVAFLAIRTQDVRRHRRWMIRAFAVGTGIATIRIWVGLFTGIQIAVHGGTDGLTLPVRDTFALSFWLALGMHTAIGEWWLRRTPDRDG